MSAAALQDTICAISTPPGQGAIAMIRLSGSEAHKLASSLLYETAVETTPIKGWKPNETKLARIGTRKKLIDEVMVTFYRAPRSYTGEDMVELSCHGSMYIQQQIMLALTDTGARLAAPGEFTQRAFLNRKMDLAQAEAVADLIAAESAAAHRLALSQMRGVVSEGIRTLRNRLVEITSLVELELDFSEEEVEFANRETLLDLAREIQSQLTTLSGSFKQGNALKKGIPVAIIGEPNVGKSTLLNLLLEDERAIVSEVPGTTRDFLEDTVTLEGFLFRFIDTAGLRPSADHVEKMGIERTYQKISTATVVLYVTEIGAPQTAVREKVKRISSLLKAGEQHLAVVVNKTDSLPAATVKAREATWQSYDGKVLFISALKDQGTEALRHWLVTVPNLHPPGDQEIIITNLRHYQALTAAAEATGRIIAGLQEGLTGDLVAQDLREAIHFMGEITGEITTDEILGKIFSTFCIGK